MKYALLIGNNNYDDPKLPQLKAPTEDLEHLKTVLRDPKIGNFDEVESLIDKNKDDVSDAIVEFLDGKKPDDIVLVYFSGHGILDTHGKLFLALKNSYHNKLKVNAISSDFIKNELDDCRSQKKILILDCCYSGAFKRGTKTGEQQAIPQSNFEGNGSGYFVLTSSKATQRALEADQVIDHTKLSLFTHFLIDGLTTGRADTNEDGNVSLNDWYDYAYKQVTSSTSDQDPTMFDLGHEGTFYIAKNPLAKKNAAFPKDLNNLIASSRPKARMDAADWLGDLLSSSDTQLAQVARLSLENLARDNDSQVSSEAQKQLLDFERSIREREATEKAQLEAKELIRQKAEQEKLVIVIANRVAYEKARLEAEEQARQKADREAGEKVARLKADEEEQQRIAREKAQLEAEELTRQKAERGKLVVVIANRIVFERARLEAEEKARQKTAKEKADREAVEWARLKAEEKARQKVVKNNSGRQTLFWIIGFLGIVIFIFLSPHNGILELSGLSESTTTPTSTYSNYSVTQTELSVTHPTSSYPNFPATQTAFAAVSTPKKNRSCSCV